MTKKKYYDKGLILVSFDDGSKEWMGGYVFCKTRKVIKIASYDEMTKTQASEKMQQINNFASKSINPKLCLIEPYKPFYKITFKEWLKTIEDRF